MLNSWYVELLICWTVDMLKFNVKIITTKPEWKEKENKEINPKIIHKKIYIFWILFQTWLRNLKLIACLHACLQWVNHKLNKTLKPIIFYPFQSHSTLYIYNLFIFVCLIPKNINFFCWTSNDPRKGLKKSEFRKSYRLIIQEKTISKIDQQLKFKIEDDRSTLEIQLVKVSSKWPHLLPIFIRLDIGLLFKKY